MVKSSQFVTRWFGWWWCVCLVVVGAVLEIPAVESVVVMSTVHPLWGPGMLAEACRFRGLHPLPLAYMPLPHCPAILVSVILNLCSTLLGALAGRGRTTVVSVVCLVVLLCAGEYYEAEL
jgi:hypothetical protein